MTRRAAGTGSISYLRGRGYWIAKVRLADGRRVARKRWTEVDAEAALAELLIDFSDRLGYHYRVPRPYWWGERENANPRAGVTARARFRALERDGFRCRYCGTTAAEARLTIDHAVSLADGGTSDEANLVAACEECNAGKGSRSVPMFQGPPPT